MQEYAALGANTHSKEYLEEHHGIEVPTVSIRAPERALGTSQLGVIMPGSNNRVRGAVKRIKTSTRCLDTAGLSTACLNWIVVVNLPFPLANYSGGVRLSPYPRAPQPLVTRPSHRHQTMLSVSLSPASLP